MEERRRLLTDEFVPWIRESIGDFLKTLDLQVDSTTGGVGAAKSSMGSDTIGTWPRLVKVAFIWFIYFLKMANAYTCH